MENSNYIDLVQSIISGSISLEAVIDLMEVDRAKAQFELSQSAKLMGYTYGNNPSRLPVYFFDGYSCPNAALLMHISKLYSFAQIGSAYSTHKMSIYDVREHDPYTQVGVYDPSRMLFVAGLRFLPLNKGIDYEKSSMSNLFIAKKTLLKYLPKTLELGTTFIIPDVQKTVVATHYLLSAMSFAIVTNDPKYLIGRPTIPGIFNNDLKELISAWLCKEFPSKNVFLNPEGKLFVAYHRDVPTIQMKAFEDFVDEYKVEYNSDWPMRQKILSVNRMVKSMGVSFPHIISFYAAITENPERIDSHGMITLGTPVENHIYMSKSWEIGILVIVEKIATSYTRYLDYAKNSICKI